MFFLGEQPSPIIFIGAAVVICGVSMIMIAKDSKLA
jgi:drug/metabolite transporter (DMT)-like permease